MDLNFSKYIHKNDRSNHSEIHLEGRIVTLVAARWTKKWSMGMNMYEILVHGAISSENRTIHSRWAPKKVYW